MENFASLRDALLAGGGAREVKGADSLAAATAELLENTARRDTMARQAASTLRAHQGATSRTADLVGQFVP
jgi:3-deoxy-D-manno-octulosonic-acid transferase